MNYQLVNKEQKLLYFWNEIGVFSYISVSFFFCLFCFKLGRKYTFSALLNRLKYFYVLYMIIKNLNYIIKDKKKIK